MPILYEELKHHSIHHLYFTEFTKYRGNNYELGCIICTSKTSDGLLIEAILGNIDRPVADRSN